MNAQRSGARAAGPRRGPAGRREAQSAIRREQVLSAALALFCEHGYAGTSTRRIAEAAGITEGLVFHYFPTKEALLFAVAARQHMFAGRVLMLVQRAEELSARALLRAIAGGFAEVTAEERAFVGFMHAEAQTNLALRELVTGANAVMLERFTAALARRVEAGELRADASLTAAALGFFGGFLFFFTEHRHLGAAAWRREAAAFAAAWAEQCWRGIAAPAELSRCSTSDETTGGRSDAR